MTTKPVAEFKVSRMGEVMATIAYVPSGVIGALNEQIFDLLSHHRKAVISAAGQEFKSPSRGKRFIASRLFRHTRQDAKRIGDVLGRGFVGTREQPGEDKRGQPFPLSESFFELLEEGGTQTTTDPMAVPIGAGVVQSGPFAGRPTARFVKALENNEFDVIERPGNPALLVLELEGRRSRSGSVGVRTAIMGVLVRRRRQRAILHYQETFDRIIPKHNSRLQRLAEQATTAAGEAAIAKRQRAVDAGRAAFVRTLARELDADPSNSSGARKAARLAATEARKKALGSGRA